VVFKEEILKEKDDISLNLIEIDNENDNSGHSLRMVLIS
jgi:hypothetical protein